MATIDSLRTQLAQERSARLAAQEQINELKLDQIRLKQDNERRLRESNGLLDGLHVLTSSLDTKQMLRGMLNVLRGVLEFEQACVILLQADGLLHTIAATTPNLANRTWEAQRFFDKVLSDKSLAAFDVGLLPEWQTQMPLGIEVTSALHMPIRTPISAALLIGTHSQRGFFTRDHLKLADRFRPMAAQALRNAELHNALRSERDQLEQYVEARTRDVLDSQTRYQTVIDTALDAVVGMDANGNVTDWNQKAEEIFGWTKAEAAGRPMHDLIIPHAMRDAHQAGLHRYFVTGKGPVLNKRIEIEALRRSGELFPVELAVTPIEVDGTKAFSAFIRDITHRKAAQQATEQAREEAIAADRAKSEFLANMSHEIRTPLNAVLGLSGLLLDTPLTDNQRDYLNTIRTSGDGLLTIINDILDFSKIEAGKLELEEQPFDLRRAVEESLDLVSSDAAHKKLDLAYFIEPETPSFVVGDVTRLRQILTNLLSNAVKFTHEGEIVVAARSTSLGEGQHTLHFDVRDTGIGIPQERRDRLFEAFSQVDASTTREYGGTGLGLAITKRLCSMMGGKVSLESEWGQGSTFSFTIVVNEADVDSAELARYDFLSAQPKQLEGRRVLIVDDNLTNRHLLEKQLTAWGMSVESAESGYEALGIVAVQTPFDLAILDVFMPRMDGIQLSAELSQRVPTMPQIILSSSGRSELSSGNLDVYAYLNKPLKPSQLYSTLINLFSGQPAYPPLRKPTSEFDHTLGERHPLRILVAEDNAVNQRVALRLLEQLGYRADVAGNGVEVLAALRLQLYDVVLMDIQMPEMDGVTATAHIVEQFSPRPRIVAMTANALKGDREKYLAAGLDDYISKPVRVAALRAALERCQPINPHRRMSEPPINIALLREQYGDMADEILADLLPLFLEEADNLLETLQAAARARDVEGVWQTAHALKGASVSVGATVLSDLCHRTEMEGKAGNLEVAEAQIGGILAEIGRIKAR